MPELLAGASVVFDSSLQNCDGYLQCSEYLPSAIVQFTGYPAPFFVLYPQKSLRESSQSLSALEDQRLKLRIGFPERPLALMILESPHEGFLRIQCRDEAVVESIP